MLMIIRSPKEFAAWAVHRRKMLGLTQTELGDQAGLKQKTISAFENAPDNMRLSTAFLILSALELNSEAVPKGAHPILNRENHLE